MQNTVHSVTTTVKICFRDGSEYNLPLIDPSNIGIDTYCTSISLKEKLYTRNNNNVIGNICANTLSLKIISNDGLLVSSNFSSPYYGMMNNTAYIEVNCTGDDNVTTFMGRYFVDAWENGVTASTANEVNISAIDLLGKIKNVNLRKLRLQRKLNVNTYLVSVLDKLNSGLPAEMHVLYNIADLDIFKNSQYPWQLWYNNIDRDSFENILNSIAQNTLSHLWIDRDGYFKTDWLLDDSQEEVKCTLSGSIQLFDYGTDIADNSFASGVDITYIDNVSYQDSQLADIKDYPLSNGTNVINNLNLNSDKILNINTIEIICANGNAYCKSFFNYKNSIDLNIYATQSTTANIKIWGTTINEITNIISYNINPQNYTKDNIQINNNILRKELINTYTQGVAALINGNLNYIYVEGLINPALKIGDIVMVQGSKLGVNNKYKIIGMDFKLGTNYRCKLDLVKVLF